MKKIFLGFAALILTITSCSKSQVTESIGEEQGVIRFSAISGNVSTKATETVMLNLETSGVDLFAFTEKDGTYAKYFTDALEHDADGWKTTVAAKRYLKEGFKNEFYSVYPKGTTDADKLLAGGIGFDYTVKATAQEDLLGAKATGTYTPSGDQSGVTVTMPFKHLLAQANVGVNNSIVGLGHVEITAIAFNAVGSAGTYTFGTEEWTAPTHAAFTMLSSINTENDPAAPSGHYLGTSLMLVPAAFATSTITFKFQAYDLAGTEITNGETVGAINLDATVITNPDAAWKAGLRYIYLIDFMDWYANRELKFGVSVDGWENFDWGTTTGAGTGVVEIIK